MDQSASQLATTAMYGGSDIASLSFNRPRYVRYASVNAPREFGPIGDAGLDLEGVVGAESGSQTLFFSFDVPLSSQIGLRRVLLNRYTDQYVSISLSGEDGPIPLGADGFANSLTLAPDDPASQSVLTFDLGYVTCGYWLTGYCEADCTQSSVFVADSGGGSVDDPSAEFSSPLAGLMPAGAYRITVSSSEWPQLPYRIQLVVNPARDLSGTSDIRDETSGRIGTVKLTGRAEMRAAPSGTLNKRVTLSGSAAMEARPTGTITRISPYGS